MAELPSACVEGGGGCLYLIFSASHLSSSMRSGVSPSDPIVRIPWALPGRVTVHLLPPPPPWFPALLTNTLPARKKSLAMRETPSVPLQSDSPSMMPAE